MCPRRQDVPTPVTSRSTWWSCSPTSRSSRRTSARVSRCSSTRCRTSSRTTSARCARRATSFRRSVRRWSSSGRACRTCRRSSRPEVVLGTPLPLRPHRPAHREDADRAVLAPVEREDAGITDEALDALFDASGGYPYFIQAYGKAAWDAAPADPITAMDVSVAAPEADAELAVGFFGSRYERATPAEREYLRSMAELTREGIGRQHRPGGRPPEAQALVAVARAGLAHQERPGLQRGTGSDRLHRATFRPVPARPRGVTTATRRCPAVHVFSR